MAAVATSHDVDALLDQDAPVAVGVSGGKDSQAAAIATFRYLDLIKHSGPRLLIHADLGTVEWKDSLPTCERLARYLGTDLSIVARKAGGLMERWESRWQSSKERYETLSTVTLVPCWSTPSMRFCTSELKTHVITAELKRRFPGQKIVNVTGVRADESAARSRQNVTSADSEGRILNWRPILRWSVDDVFNAIDTTGLEPHPAYRIFGMSRVSCRYCIMSNANDLVAASQQQESHALYRRMVQLEIVSGFAFQGARWLSDIASHILSAETREAVQLAKHKALLRKQIESTITKPMLYVKGWPTRMLTDEEAEILASARSKISDLYGFTAQHLTADSIHERYAGLLAARAAREPEAA